MVPGLMVQTYADWGGKLRSDAKYKDAVDKYQYVATNSSLPEQKQAATKSISETYNDWGKWHFSRQEFTEAMDKYASAKQATNDVDVVTAASVGYDTALKALSEDSLGQGKKVLDQALAEAMQGKLASSPAIGLATGQPGKARFDTPELTLPPDLEATKPANFLYAILTGFGATEVSRCRYTSQSSDTYYLVLRQFYWHLRVVSTRTGAVIAERIFNGPWPPGGCPATYQFTLGKPAYLTGDPPQLADVVTWLRTIVR